ncbi:MAG TPA: non-ribosomal peptide synthetase [Gemmatimonadales bacterium]|jgi:amino acid adenylation domain-containing protein|nr:non-ribosomal peptide synthetase [Gemmatimonadales bacterium]
MTILAGPTRTLPDRRAHEVFEDQVRLRPEAIAAVHGSRQVTYGELNARANQVARALLERGLTREGVVGVMTERNLEWLIAVLAVFKAGGAYMPIEPHFPAERVAKMQSRAGCHLVVTERLVETACAEGHRDGDLRLPTKPDQLAYIYFTSGSTGEPKGAMCEHAGLLNHLFAKIDDLQIAAGTVVAQTAPQCFDISLWQLLAALLVGGRVVIVEQETILDAKRFIDRIADARVNIVQVVPSYLDVLVAHLAQHRRELRDLEYVVATGEALKKELVERWFAVQPGIKLVNAYGLTETSDDTNHEIMDRAPRGERVPLGRPINNVHIYIVDEHLQSVAAGESGEIVFSGVCVGRGYINDAERTQRAFLQDPRRPGQRLYRSGDFGRSLPDGKLEFLGRRDSQVKLHGFRIEIGEVENALLRVAGVRDGAVVVNAHLVALYAGERPLDPAVIRDKLAESLPAYMIPSAFHWRKTLPLTENGKIDRKALTALAAELEHGSSNHEAPATAAEERLAGAWADVLGIPKDQIGRHDRFFDLGATSLAALKLVIALDRAVSLKDLTSHPTLADQAALIEVT